MDIVPIYKRVIGLDVHPSQITHPVAVFAATTPHRSSRQLAV